MNSESLILIPAVFTVAVLYSSVGHGGASGYLALMALLSLPHHLAATNALILNILVSGTAFLMFRQAGHFRWGLVWPFLVGSVPAAALGGHWRISSPVYSLILAAALAFAALRLWMNSSPRATDSSSGRPRLPLSMLIGAILGFVSGLVGIGGGVFLSPILLLSGWADVKQTSAASSFFILANSAAGLWGRIPSLPEAITPLGFLMIAAAFLGGSLGSQWGACRLSGPMVRRVLGLVLATASAKLFLMVL